MLHICDVYVLKCTLTFIPFIFLQCKHALNFHAFGLIKDYYYYYYINCVYINSLFCHVQISIYVGSYLYNIDVPEN